MSIRSSSKVIKLLVIFWFPTCVVIKYCIKPHSEPSDTIIPALHKNSVESESGHSERILANSEIVEIALVVQGYEYIQTALVLLKSVLLFTGSHVLFHIFAFDDSPSIVIQELKTWPQWITRRYDILTYTLNCSHWEEYLEDTNKLHRFPPKLCMMFTLYENKKFQKVIILDADTFVMSNIQILWNYFRNFNNSQIMAMSTGGKRYYNKALQYDIYQGFGVNSGVMLIDWYKSRQARYMDNITHSINTQWGQLLKLGDQDFSNMFFGRYPEKLYLLPCSWNFRKPCDNCSRDAPDLHCQEAWLKGIHILHSTSFEGFFGKGYFSPLYKIVQQTHLWYPLDAPWKSVLEAADQLRTRYCGDSIKPLLKSISKRILWMYFNSPGEHLPRIKDKLVNITQWIKEQN